MIRNVDLLNSKGVFMKTYRPIFEMQSSGKIKVLFPRSKEGTFLTPILASQQTQMPDGIYTVQPFALLI